MKPRSLLHVVLAVVLVIPGLALADEPAAPAATGSASLVNLELGSVTVQEAIARLFQGRTESYILSPGVSGKISELKLKGITLEQAVKALTDAAGLTYEIEGRSYMISPKVRIVTVQTTTATTAIPPSTATTAAAEPAASTTTMVPVVTGTVPTEVTVYDQMPVYYGQPQMGGPNGGGSGFFPPPVQVGNIQVLPGWPSVVIAGSGPTVWGRQPMPIGPSSWTPDQMRFWAGVSAVQPQWYFGPGYGPGGYGLMW